MEQLEVRNADRDMLVTEEGLFGILNNSYKRVNIDGGGYDIGETDANKIPTLGYMFESISNYLKSITKNSNNETEYVRVDISGTDPQFYEYDLYLPTIGLMKDEIDRIVELKLTDGNLELQLDSLNIGSGISTSNIKVKI